MILSVSYKPYLISQLSFDYICSLEILQHWPVSLFVTIHFTLSPFLGGGGKNTGVGCHSLLQEIFLTQKLNLGLLHCQQMLYSLSHQGGPFFFFNRHWALTELSACVWCFIYKIFTGPVTFTAFDLTVKALFKLDQNITSIFK